LVKLRKTYEGKKLAEPQIPDFVCLDSEKPSKNIKTEVKKVKIKLGSDKKEKKTVETIAYSTERLTETQQQQQQNDSGLSSKRRRMDDTSNNHNKDGNNSSNSSHTTMFRINSG